MSKGKFKYDYFTIRLPLDILDGERYQDDPDDGRFKEDLCTMAIAEAKDKTTLYCIPAEWSAQIVGSENGDWLIRVRRKRLRS